MERIKNPQLLGSRYINCGNVTNSNNTTITLNKADEDNQISQWLSPLEPRHRHRSVQTNRVEGVGGWLLERNKFREWSSNQRAPKQAVLFCHGDPGVGKTHISSLVIDQLCNQVRNRDMAVAGLYYDYLAQEEQSTTNMLGAILKQLLERNGIPEHVRQAFREEKKGFGGRAAQLLNLMKILKTTIASLSEVFICIDGLDECVPDNRRELLESLRDVVQASPTTRVFLSGRPHIRDEIKRYFAKAVMIRVIPTIRDIERYLKMRLDRDNIPSAMDDKLRAEIMRVIPRKFSQIFLLVSLNIDAVLEEVTIHQRKKKLDQMIQGNGLRDAYSATLARIKAQGGSKSKLGMEVLMWLSHSERPLNANELCHALGVEIGSADLNSQNIPAIETLLGCSLGLVTVEASSYTVRLVHHTLQEYLSNNASLFHSPHAMIAEVCLTYLNFQCIRNLSPTLRRSPPATPFLEYASCYWGTHARREITESANILALTFLDGFDKHVSSGVLLSHNCDNWDGELCWSNTTGFTGLHCTAYLGIVETSVALLKMKKWDLDATDVAGNTAVSWAAKKGHGAVMKMLLEQEGIAPNTADKDGRTPLWWAVVNRHRDIVEMLLKQKDVTPNTADKGGRTPLLWAARMGREDIVNMLLKQADVAPNTADIDGRTPLLWATINGREDVVKTLLEREDVTPNTADKDGRTPLSWAAENGHEEVVEVLLGRKDVAPDTADEGGRTPLLWAVVHGHEEIVEMLLEREDITPNTADKNGRTPLSWAAGNGRGEVVKMLLEMEDLAPNLADKDGQTPLSWAARNGHRDIAAILLGREDVAPDTVDKGDQTPLSWAVVKWHWDIVHMLLERKDVTPNTADRNGRTPLSWAAGNGRWGIVKMLLGRGDVAPNTVDKNGRTPLSWAAAGGRWDIVQILLGREDVTPNTADEDGRTPLSWAKEHGHIRIVEMLLKPRNPSQSTAITDITSLIVPTQTSEKQRRGTLKRPGSHTSIALPPAKPSQSSQRPSKRPRRFPN